MKRITIIELMKCEVCHNHKSNCDICPILYMCQDGRVEKLSNELKDNKDYYIEVNE